MGSKLDNSEDELAENHEINVTPFIDVMLVLLIIFMVAAPLSTVDVQVDLPASGAPPQQRPEKPIFITLKSDLSLSLGNDPVDRTLIAQSLDLLTEGDREKRVFLRADKDVPYASLMETLDLLRNAGYVKIALVGVEVPPQNRVTTPQPTEDNDNNALR